MSKLDNIDKWLHKQTAHLKKLLFEYISKRPLYCSEYIYEAPSKVFKDLTGIELTHHQLRIAEKLVRDTRQVFSDNPHYNYKSLFTHAEYAARFKQMYGSWDNQEGVAMTDMQLTELGEIEDFYKSEKYKADMSAIDYKVMSRKILTDEERKKARAARKHKYFSLVMHMDMFNKKPEA